MGGGSQEHALEHAVAPNHVVDFIRSGFGALDLSLNSGSEQRHLPAPLCQRCPVDRVVLHQHQVADAVVGLGQGGKRCGFGGSGGVGDGDDGRGHAASELGCVHSSLDVSVVCLRELAGVYILFGDCVLERSATAGVRLQLEFVYIRDELEVRVDCDCTICVRFSVCDVEIGLLVVEIWRGHRAHHAGLQTMMPLLVTYVRSPWPALAIVTSCHIRISFHVITEELTCGSASEKSVRGENQQLVLIKISSTNIDWPSDTDDDVIRQRKQTMNPGQ